MFSRPLVKALYARRQQVSRESCERPAKAGSKSTRDSTTTRSMSRTESSKDLSRRKPGRHRAANQENHLRFRQRGWKLERRRPHRLRHSLVQQRPGLRPAPLATALARRRLWRRAKHQQRCSQHACRALGYWTVTCSTTLNSVQPRRCSQRARTAVLRVPLRRTFVKHACGKL